MREHLERFLREASDRSDGGGLPRFVEREFREFSTCGALGRGFARVRCESCGFERLVPFSCKRRGFCPSRGGRRMLVRCDTAAPPIPPSAPSSAGGLEASGASERDPVTSFGGPEREPLSSTPVASRGPCTITNVEAPRPLQIRGHTVPLMACVAAE